MNSERKRSVKVICPNLKYIKNKNKGDIYFISNKPIKITINNKTEYLQQIKLDDMSLSGSICYNGIDVDAQVFEEECKDGLKINLSFIDRSDICNRDIQKFGRSIEALILGFNIMDDDSFENLDNSENNTAKEDISDYYSDYYQKKFNNEYEQPEYEEEFNNNEINEQEEYYEPEYELESY